MREKEVFDFTDYKSFLEFLVGGRGTRTGKRLQLAKACQCNTTYISQVINGNGQLSLEQAYRVIKFAKFTQEEGHYFLLLVHRARAGSHDLKKYYEEQLTNILQKRLSLKERLQIRAEINPEAEARYYSQWYFAAIHSALAIPSLRTKASLAKFFLLPPSTVSEVLDFLLRYQLAKYENGKYEIGQLQIHLKKDSANIGKHHSNWRMRAISSLERESKEDVHYSGIFTCNLKTLEQIKQKIVKEIKSSVELVTESPSPDEKIYSFVIDFFNLEATSE